MRDNEAVFLEHNGRCLSSLEKGHLLKIKSWRNSQMSVLRQYLSLTNYHQKKWFLSLKDDKTQILFSLKLRTNLKLQLIGYCGLTNIDSKNRRAEISFIVDPARAKNQNIYEKDFVAVLSMLCKYAFEKLKLNKVFTDTFEFRNFHIMILEKFGFVLEGKLREHYFKSKYLNSYIHSMLNNEWWKKQEAENEFKK